MANRRMISAYLRTLATEAELLSELDVNTDNAQGRLHAAANRIRDLHAEMKEELLRPIKPRANGTAEEPVT